MISSDCSKFTKDDWLDLINDNLVKEEWIDRILENERLRAFIIDMRDNPAPISAEQVIDRLTSFTEDLEA